jgi:hypothetical protein
MSRGLVDHLRVPVTLGSLLPAIYRDLDPTTIELTEALDAVLAPVWLCLDNIDHAGRLGRAAPRSQLER